MIKTKKINAFEAKTRLSELLRETERGASFIICRRGKEVARLLPPEKKKKKDLEEILRQFQEIRSRVKGKVNVRKLIEEGRRF